MHKNFTELVFGRYINRSQRVVIVDRKEREVALGDDGSRREMWVFYGTVHDQAGKPTDVQKYYSDGRCITPQRVATVYDLYQQVEVFQNAA